MFHAEGEAVLRKHSVSSGESLALIANKYGLPRWETIYHHPLNKPLRQLRPKPSLIHPGDVLIIPDKSPQGKTKSFEEYMVRVMALEEEALAQKYSFLDRVTSFRLIHYPNRAVREYAGTPYAGGPWPLIIPGAANVQMPRTWQQEPYKSMVAYLSQCQALEIDGLEVDIGNAWAGLDARLRPSRVTITVAGIPVLEMRSNQEAASYVGDLGSVVANYAPTLTRFLWETAGKTTPAFRKIFKDWASPEDCRGDIDSYSMPLNSKKTVTQNLLDYYLAQSGGVRKRFTTFMNQVRLTLPATRQALEHEVFVAAQYFLASKKNFPEVMAIYQRPQLLERPKATIYSEVVRLTLDTFIAWCQTNARSE